jgi:hypothetical protein
VKLKYLAVAALLGSAVGAYAMVNQRRSESPLIVTHTASPATPAEDPTIFDRFGSGDLNGDGMISRPEIEKQAEFLVPIFRSNGKPDYVLVGDLYRYVDRTAPVVEVLAFEAAGIPLYARDGKTRTGTYKFPPPVEGPGEKGEVTLDSAGKATPISG